MATADGKKTGGRKPGTPNKKTQKVADIMEKFECCPIEGMVRVGQQAESDAQNVFEDYFERFKAILAEGDNEALSAYIGKVLSGNIKERREHLALAGNMYKELAQYIAPKRKAIEIDPGEDTVLESIDPSIVQAMAMAVLGGVPAQKPQQPEGDIPSSEPEAAPDAKPKRRLVIKADKTPYATKSSAKASKAYREYEGEKSIVPYRDGYAVQQE